MNSFIVSVRRASSCLVGRRARWPRMAASGRGNGRAVAGPRSGGVELGLTPADSSPSCAEKLVARWRELRSSGEFMVVLRDKNKMGSSFVVTEQLVAAQR